MAKKVSRRYNLVVVDKGVHLWTGKESLSEIDEYTMKFDNVEAVAFGLQDPDHLLDPTREKNVYIAYDKPKSNNQYFYALCGVMLKQDAEFIDSLCNGKTFDSIEDQLFYLKKLMISVIENRVKNHQKTTINNLLNLFDYLYGSEKKNPNEKKLLKSMREEHLNEVTGKWFYDGMKFMLLAPNLNSYAGVRNLYFIFSSSHLKNFKMPTYKHVLKGPENFQTSLLIPYDPTKDYRIKKPGSTSEDIQMKNQSGKYNPLTIGIKEKIDEEPERPLAIEVMDLFKDNRLFGNLLEEASKEGTYETLDAVVSEHFGKEIKASEIIENNPRYKEYVLEEHNKNKSKVKTRKR